MKKHLLIASLAICFIIGCQSREQKLKSQIEPLIKQVILSDSLAAKVDSIRIYKIDTLTDFILAQTRINNLARKADFQKYMVDNFLSQVKLQQSSAKISHSQAQLYAGEFHSGVLTKISVDEAKEHLQSAVELTDSAQAHNNKVIAIADTMTAILKRMKADKYSKKNFNGYVAHFAYRGASKKNTLVKADSLWIFLTPNLRIIPVNSIN